MSDGVVRIKGDKLAKLRAKAKTEKRSVAQVLDMILEDILNDKA